MLCLQETKVEDSGFPTHALRDAGYEVAIYGQRSYNGVAIASRARRSRMSCAASAMARPTTKRG